MATPVRGKGLLMAVYVTTRDTMDPDVGALQFVVARPNIITENDRNGHKPTATKIKSESRYGKLEREGYIRLIKMLTGDDHRSRIRALNVLKKESVWRNAPLGLVSLVCDLTTHRQEAIRRRAVLALGNAKASDIVLSTLDKAVSDTRHSVRRNAAVSLGKIGDRRAVEPLCAALEDSNERVQRKAAEVLGRLGDARAIVPLIGALGDRDDSVRQAAAEALGRLGDPQALEPLAGALTDFYRDVRCAVVTALGELGDKRAVQPLTKALNDIDTDVRQRARQALTMLGAPPDDRTTPVSNQHIEDALPALAEVSIPVGETAVEACSPPSAPRDARIASAVTEVLGKIGDGRAIEPLISTLSESDRSIFQGAVEALERFGEPAIESLLETLKSDDLEMRLGVTRALGQIWQVPDLVDLGSKDWGLRSEAGWALGNQDDKRVVEPLIAALKDERPLVRRAATKSLGKLADVRALDSLVGALEDSNALVRSGAADALGELGDARAAVPLIESLGDEDLEVRRAATTALEALGECAIDPLIDTLLERKGAVQRRAAQVLANQKDPKLVQPFISALKTGDGIVKWEAVRALKQIGTHDALAAVQRYQQQLRQPRIKRLITAVL
jgi:HEAT repeat protein